MRRWWVRWENAMFLCYCTTAQRSAAIRVTLPNDETFYRRASAAAIFFDVINRSVNPFMMRNESELEPFH